MKKNMISRFSICGIIFFISVSIQGQYTNWEKDVEYNNIKFDKIRFIIKEKDTTYIEGYLSQKTTINGYPCYKNVVFEKDWKLQQFLLSENHFMFGAQFPKDTEVRFYKDKIHCFFGRNTIIQGYCCKGNYGKWYTMGISTTLYLNGKLKSFYPCKNIEINNIWCKSSPYAGIKLFENGNLKECKLANDQKINGKEYKKNTKLIFDETGAITSAE
ncbi:MAG: hypothetical protein KQI35_09520 [Bacteroidetes bacterium]|nr:hypothetical protein [Bacteroidota bacterium]